MFKDSSRLYPCNSNQWLLKFVEYSLYVVSGVYTFVSYTDNFMDVSFFIHMSLGMSVCL